MSLPIGTRHIDGAVPPAGLNARPVHSESITIGSNGENIHQLELVAEISREPYLEGGFGWIITLCRLTRVGSNTVGLERQLKWSLPPSRRIRAGFPGTWYTLRLGSDTGPFGRERPGESNLTQFDRRHIGILRSVCMFAGKPKAKTPGGKAIG